MESSTDGGLEARPNASSAGVDSTSRTQPQAQRRERSTTAMLFVTLCVAELMWLAFLTWMVVGLF